LDVIDKLDVTGVYGTGLFHHDGPFDACNPHRNKSSRRLAPVQAFPADSANNSMTGFGPLPAKTDHSSVFGNREPEAFNDYTITPARPAGARAHSFDPKSADTLHGDESLGLGTSTFLDGAPASRAAIKQKLTEAEEQARPRTSSDAAAGGGLQRKKSLAQKFRSISTSKGVGPASGDREPISSRRKAPPPPGQAGYPSPGTPKTPKDADGNPFFNEYDTAYDKKGETITVAGRERAPSSPKKPYPLARTGTDDGGGSGSGGGGLMKRVRSMSKSKRRIGEAA